MSDIPPSERVRDAWESWNTDRRRAAIRAVLHRVMIKPLPPGAASNPASNIKDKAVRREREMAVLRRVHSSLKERAGVKRGFGLRFRGCRVFAGHAELAPWLCLSPRRCRVRASGLAGSRTGRSPAAGGGAGGVLDAGAREPMIVACGEGPLLFQGSRVCGCRRPTAGQRPGSLLAAFIPSFVPGCPRGAWGGFAPGRAGSITGAPAPPWGGGQNERRPRARPQARTGHAACPRWRARRTCPSRIP